MWVFGLCVHTMSLGQLKRLEAITGVATGVQTKARALIAGIVALAKHTTRAKVIVQLATVWDAWHQPRSRAPFQDLLEDVTTQDFDRATVLYISRNARTPDAPGNEPQLRRRQRDSALTAWERAKTLHDQKQADWQDTLDDDHKLIYQHAVQRLAKIYDDPMHYIHQKAPRHQGRQTKQHKRDLVKQRNKAWSANHHRWEPHRSGYQCTACGTRMHQGLTTSILETRLHEDCPQVLIEDIRNTPPSQAALAQEIHPRSSKTCYNSRRSNNQHLKSTASQRRPATSSALNVESTSTNVSMKQPSNNSSQANVWIRPSLKHMTAITPTTFGKKEIESDAPSVGCNGILMGKNASSPHRLSPSLAKEQASKAPHLLASSSRRRVKLLVPLQKSVSLPCRQPSMCSQLPPGQHHAGCTLLRNLMNEMR